jgi:hypothetical protein
MARHTPLVLLVVDPDPVEPVVPVDPVEPVVLVEPVPLCEAPPPWPPHACSVPTAANAALNLRNSRRAGAAIFIELFFVNAISLGKF